MTAQQPRKRLYSHVTKTRFLHIEDALNIGVDASRAKIRLFAGEYRKGGGATTTAFHFLDLNDARVIFSDLSWSKKVEFADYKGTTNGDGPQSRVLKIKTNGDKVWLEIQNGPGETIGQGAIKPKGKSDAAVSIPFSIWEARKLAHACLAYIRAWEAHHLLNLAPLAPIVALAESSATAHQTRPAMLDSLPPMVTEQPDQACPERRPEPVEGPSRRMAAPVTTPVPVPSSSDPSHQVQPAAPALSKAEGTPPPSPKKPAPKAPPKAQGESAVEETATGYWTLYNDTAKALGVAYPHARSVANKYGHDWKTAIAKLRQAMTEATAKTQPTA